MDITSNPDGRLQLTVSREEAESIMLCLQDGTEPWRDKSPHKDQQRMLERDRAMVRMLESRLRGKPRLSPAMERAHQLMKTPHSQSPHWAVLYADAQQDRYGLCCEVLLTAYAHYAQCVENLDCNDDNYQAGKEAKAWFDALSDAVSDPDRYRDGEDL